MGAGSSGEGFRFPWSLDLQNNGAMAHNTQNIEQKCVAHFARSVRLAFVLVFPFFKSRLLSVAFFFMFCCFIYFFIYLFWRNWQTGRHFVSLSVSLSFCRAIFDVVSFLFPNATQFFSFFLRFSLLFCSIFCGHGNDELKKKKQQYLLLLTHL